jgi:MYXO-CTERM domain-containing protein
MTRRSVAATILALALASLPARSVAEQADYTRPPVLLVHGYFVMDQAGTFTWSPFKKRLIADGWPEEYLYAPSFDDVTGCNEDHVEEIEAWVETIRKKEKVDKVDIVCHSFGCLNTLTWLKQRCGIHRVRQFVGLAGAVHGTRVACVDPFTCAAEQMCIPLFGDDSWKDNALLTAVHGCDETPGDVMYTSIWSDYDQIIRPPSGSILAGARNFEVDTPWVEHATIFMADECYARVKEALLGAGGLNEDGPGWACVPEACRPAAPEPVPEGPDGGGDEAVPPEAVEEVPDVAEAALDAGTGDLPDVADAPAGDPPTGTDRGGVVDPGVAPDPDPADPGVADDPGTPVAPRSAKGCTAGQAAGPAPFGLLLGVVAGLLRRRRAA